MSSDISQIVGVMQGRERRAVGVIALIAISRIFGLFALLPVLAIYAARLDGATPALVGIAVGGYGLTQAALQIPFGALSDRIGRLPVIVFGLLLFAGGSLLAGLSDNIYGVIVGRLLQGGGAISATLSALLADATRESVRTRSMAIFGIGIGLSFLLSLIVGPIIAAAAGVRSLFWVAASLGIVAILLLGLLPRGIRRPSRTDKPPLSEAFRPDLIRLDFYVFLLHGILTASFVALPFLLTDRLDVALADHWKLYIGALAASLLGTVPLVLADERKGKGWTLSAAILLMLAGQSLLAVYGSTWTNVFVALAVFFAGFNFLEAALPARLSIRAKGSVRGASLGVFSSAQFLGAFAGGLAGGQMLAGGNPGAVFLLCAVAAALWMVLHRLAGSGE